MSDWAKIGSLRHKMTADQALAVVNFIGDKFPQKVMFHDCGIATVVLDGDTPTYFDTTGAIMTLESAAAEKRQFEANKPKRGRPRKRTTAT